MSADQNENGVVSNIIVAATGKETVTTRVGGSTVLKATLPNGQTSTVVSARKPDVAYVSTSGDPSIISPVFAAAAPSEGVQVVHDDPNGVSIGYDPKSGQSGNILPDGSIHPH